MNFSSCPQISIVTASYNQGQFIETTIQSVLAQKYLNIEYIILDGNSTDNSVEIIKKYQDQLTYWHSEADSGASAAIEQGRQMCTGELFNWLNSDDYLLPGTLVSLGTIANKFPEFDIYTFISTGSGENGALKSHFSRWENMNFFLTSCFNPFGQESTFVRSQFLSKNDIVVRSEYQNLFDVALYEEMLVKGARVLFIDVFGGTIRHHPQAKTFLGTPMTDIQSISKLNSTLFNPQQRFWRRLSSSRISNVMKLLCQIPPTRKLVNFLLNQPDRYFVACDFVGTFCDAQESWELRYK